MVNKKEGEIMTNVLKRVNNVYIPYDVRKEMGLSDDWQEKISPARKKLVVKNALRFKEALRRLSKH